MNTRIIRSAKSKLNKMKKTFNTLLFRIMAIILLISAMIIPQEIRGQRLSRDLNVDLLINQVGYVPSAGKKIVTKGKVNGKFEVIDLESRMVVFTGFLHPEQGDFGDYSAGDFSELRRTGHYYIKYDTLRSWPFAISPSIYKPAMDLIVSYFSLQTVRIEHNRIPLSLPY